jgi:hypothetical protein
VQRKNVILTPRTAAVFFVLLPSSFFYVHTQWLACVYAGLKDGMDGTTSSTPQSEFFLLCAMGYCCCLCLDRNGGDDDDNGAVGEEMKRRKKNVDLALVWFLKVGDGSRWFIMFYF